MERLDKLVLEALEKLSQDNAEILDTDGFIEELRCHVTYRFILEELRKNGGEK